jgi:hypothetical protein
MMVAFLDEGTKVRKKRVGNPRVGNPVNNCIFVQEKFEL